MKDKESCLTGSPLGYVVGIGPSGTKNGFIGSVGVGAAVRK